MRGPRLRASGRECSAPSGAGVFSSPERPPFANIGKSGQKCRQKPMVFGFPLCRFQCGGKRFCMELTMGLPSLPLTWWAGKVGGSTDIGDYQIAHLPPLAASVGAASWAAEYKKIRAATKRIL